MALCLKCRQRKRGLYLQIVDSVWDPDRGKNVQLSYYTPGYVEDLKRKQGLDDPVEFYREQIKAINESQRVRKAELSRQQIGDSPERCCGYFPLKQIWNGLRVRNYLDLLQKPRKFEFSLCSLLEGLTYARIVDPCSKRKTWQDVLPQLFEKYEFSYDQILRGLEFAGREYEKIVEIFTHQIRARYTIDSSSSFMDCTNFWFEIDQEDDYRRKGPSKEKRHDPIIGMGLLLDANLIPYGLKMYPGNGSEQPVLREMIADLKSRAGISGRTVQVADKGLNCAENIYAAVSDGDGYIFSKSVKKLSETEKKWVELKDGWEAVRDAEGNVVFCLRECIAEFPYSFRLPDGGKKSFELTEKRVLTFNPALARKQRHEIEKLVNKAKHKRAAQAKRDEYGEAGKYVVFKSVDKNGNESGGKITTVLNTDKIREDLRFAGYNLLVTSELKMDKRTVYDVYHRLWRIEETFKCLKSYLEARPVFLQKYERIFGHFLICYLGILLTRILQFFVLDHEYETPQLFEFMRSVQVVRTPRDGWINLTSASPLIKNLASDLHAPLMNYFLTSQQLNALFTKII